MKFDELSDDPEDARYTVEERASAASLSTWVSVGVNLLLPVTQVTVGLMSKSQGPVADGIHSLSDLVADFVLTETEGVRNVHDVRTRKMGDMIVVDAHLEVDAAISVERGHDIAVAARQRVLQRHRVLNLMTHVDPWRRPDLDHAAPAVQADP
ncbi:cation transporter dimerization domain-containing protein [Variovorax ginsengisoli]|uniref:Cation transporter dimerization domain-containing protein n=1 Tax=Variovorax ginsengisoli TaxID=363844 RepID=A0ABT8SG22_9BURK|nr:cation transporter dimerization domain-containing protein [Variovorax ginsengisoli]MDN8618667.1 cation transporter dimerization domain-containing protein [Variovorax ginsengisoli]MDO1537837.1 cation transporter dimerization domain-containing protein [Variovorax ginsengisoli]